MPISLIHIITGLSTGGAEMMLLKLLTHMDHTRYFNQVISLTDIGSVGDTIQSIGIPVTSLNMQLGVPNPTKLVKLSSKLRARQPQIIQTWMYHADLIGGLVGRIATNAAIVWNLRQSNLDPVASKRTTAWTARLCARLSRSIPRRIICGSEAARTVHGELGYDRGRMLVIPNGFDLTQFQPDPVARQAVRQMLGIPEDHLLIGLIARFDPQKDHANFIQSAKLLADRHPQVHFLLCGTDISMDNLVLANLIHTTGVTNRFHLLGRRTDIPKITAALDIACSSSSFGEGFPNVIGEAMACGIPCVVTDVGDSARIVGNTGIIVSPRDPAALVHGWECLLQMGQTQRALLGNAARERIAQLFSLDTVVAQYQALYEELAVLQ
jgi:glycosyltransferase involved in cell wall biosynthesis